MPRRPTTEQILQWNERRGRGRIGSEFVYLIDNLARTWNAAKSRSESDDFVFVRLNTILEVFVRETVRGIVDKSDKYLDRAEKFLKDAKLDRLVAKHLRGQILTIGDIVAHNISLSTLDELLSVYEQLMPGFRNALSTVTERWVEDKKSKRKPIVSDIEKTLAAVSKIMEVRNILVHEIPEESPYNASDVKDYIDYCKQFVSAIGWYITGELWGDVPRTQTQMNVTAGESLAAEEEVLSKLIGDLTARGEPDSAKLAASQEAWERYADADAKLHASLVEGGTMYPLIWATQKTVLTKARIKALRWWLERSEGEM